MCWLQPTAHSVEEKINKKCQALQSRCKEQAKNKNQTMRELKEFTEIVGF